MEISPENFNSDDMQPVASTIIGNETMVNVTRNPAIPSLCLNIESGSLSVLIFFEQDREQFLKFINEFLRMEPDAKNDSFSISTKEYEIKVKHMEGANEVLEIQFLGRCFMANKLSCVNSEIDKFRTFLEEIKQKIE